MDNYSLVTAQIDLDAIGSNIRTLKHCLHENCRFMAVVKADAYGHGAVITAETAVLCGAEWLGVARLEEAVELRDAGITAPVLVFGYVYPEQVQTAIDLDITLTVYGYGMARALSDAAGGPGRAPDVHLKVDTGMGRVGMIVNDTDDPENLENRIQEIEKIAALPGISLKGIYTHFASADSEERRYTLGQIDIFSSLLDKLKQRGVEFELRHAANSAGILAYPASHLDMVRAGISLYGLRPSNSTAFDKKGLVPVMTLKSIITSVKKVPKGFCVSYGMTHVTPRPTVLASVPVGYADGYSRHFSSCGTVLVNGKKAPVVGRVCMDQIMIDVGHITNGQGSNIRPGDDVILMGQQKEEFLGADELAQKIGTINYEIVSGLTARVKRIYSGSGSASG